MRCIFDNNLPQKLAKTLDFLEGEDGVHVNHITDFVSGDTPDSVWLRDLSQEDCFILTRDNMIKKRPHELEAWKESKLSIVFLQKTWMKQEFWDICWKLIKYWPNVKQAVSDKKVPSTYLLHVQGKIEFLEKHG